VTNNHVVKDADRILVRLGPRNDVPARLVGADPKTDLAVLKVSAALLVQAEWGDSDQLDIGDWVLAIGSPLGFDHSVTAGIVSATERNDVGIGEYESLIQTDAAINPGNSGGPLVNLAGKVVGINTAIFTQSGGNEGIGFAIPSSLARRVVEGLIKDGKVIRGYLGVIIEPLSAEDARKLKLPDNHGALVMRVQPGGPADGGGLKRGDVIVRLGDRDVADPAELRLLTASLDVGAQVPLSFFRDGVKQTAKVTIAELPEVPEAAYLGFHVKDVTTPDGKGGFVEVDAVQQESVASQSGLRPGMKIVAVGRMPVRSTADLGMALRHRDPEAGIPLFILSQDGKHPVLLPLGDGHGPVPEAPGEQPEPRAKQPGR
jgi:serine protease Do